MCVLPLQLTFSTQLDKTVNKKTLHFFDDTHFDVFLHTFLLHRIHVTMLWMACSCRDQSAFYNRTVTSGNWVLFIAWCVRYKVPYRFAYITRNVFTVKMFKSSNFLQISKTLLRNGLAVRLQSTQSLEVSKINIKRTKFLSEIYHFNRWMILTLSKDKWSEN